LRQSPFSEQRPEYPTRERRNARQPDRENSVTATQSSPASSDTTTLVVPQIVNAILSRHNFILLGLRGQAKSRILRALTSLLDPQAPYVTGCEIHDNPYAPICACQERLQKLAANGRVRVVMISQPVT